MNSEDRLKDRLAALSRGAQRIDELEREIAHERARQDAAIVEARREGAPWSDIVAADGRSRQMLNRVFKAATE